jgi:DeoR/GlpR family transcriptional regulator of sugar metabolism
MNDRCVKILDLLANNKKIKVKLLAEMLDVSFVTLRKDLDNLEKRGFINRTHGYAGLDGADNTGRRMAIKHSIKRRIAKAAAQTVEEGETIMLESGSCCALLAEELVFAKKNISIVTNSVYIANYISKMPNIRVTLLGGHFQPESQVLVGAMTVKCARSLFSDKFFLGTDGFIPEYGFTGRDCLRAETAVKLTKQTKEVFILTEAAKFQRRGACNMIKFDKLAGVFTDDSIPKEAEDVLMKNNVLLHKVPSVEEKIKWHQFPGQPPVFYKKTED